MMDFSKATSVLAGTGIHEGQIRIHNSDVGELGLFTTANTEAAKSWKHVAFSWHNPQGNVVLVIETPYTERQQPFTVVMSNRMLGTGVRFVQIVDGKEFDVTGNDETIHMNCDSNYRVVLRILTSTQAVYVIEFSYDVVGK